MLEAKRNGLIRNRLTHLDFKGDFPAIANAVAKTTRLEQLTIAIERKDLLLLGHTVHHHPSLKELSVRGTGEFPQFCTSNKSYGRIEKLKAQYVTDFLDLILSDTSLTSLHLDHMLTPEFHLEILGKYLSSPESTLESLYLEEFLEFDDYYKFFKLAKGLYYNTTLKKLAISQSQAFFEHADLAVFAKLFTLNTSICAFHLDIQRMGTDENIETTAKLYHRLTEAIRNNPNITELYLSGFGQLEGHEKEILFSENLQRLTLFKVIAKASRNREVHIQNYRSLADLIIKSPNLTHLTLHVSDIDIESVRALANALSQNTTLKALYLDFYEHQQDLAAIIVGSVLHNTTLVKLNLFDESEVPDDNASITLAKSIVKRNRTLQKSLFGQLYEVAESVKDSDYDHNGNFTTKKRTIEHETPSGKRQHIQ